MHPILSEHPKMRALQARRAKAVADVAAAKAAFDEHQSAVRRDYSAAFVEAVNAGHPTPPEPVALSPQQRAFELEGLEGPIQEANAMLPNVLADIAVDVERAAARREVQILADAAGRDCSRAALDALAGEANELVAAVKQVRKALADKTGRYPRSDVYPHMISAAGLVELAQAGEPFLSGEVARRERAENAIAPSPFAPTIWTTVGS